MKTAEAEFNKAMTALHLEVDESIANDIRQKAENYAKEYAKEEVLMWHKVIGDFLALINRQIEDNEKPIFVIETDKLDDRPKCDECGKPLTDDELKIGTCEDCLCPE